MTCSRQQPMLAAAGAARRRSARPATPRRARVEAIARGARGDGGARRRSSGRSRSRTLANGLERSRAACADRGRRRELRGEAERAAGHRGAGPEERERGRSPHRRRGARDGHGARRRRAAPALEEAACRAKRSGSCARADRAGAEALVSLPELDPARDPARQRPVDGRARTARGRSTACGRLRTPRAAASSTSHGRRRRRAARGDRRASLDRLGVCNRLNLALVDRDAAGLLPTLSRLAEHGVERRDAARRRRRRLAARRADRLRMGGRPRARRDGDARTSSTGSTRPCGSRTRDLWARRRRSSPRTSPRPSGSSTLYRGTAAFWHATTRFTDGFELTGAPETGINVDWRPGPARPRHLPRPVAAAVPRRRRRHAAAMRIVVKLGSSLVATSKGARPPSLLAARAREVGELVARRHPVCIVSSGAIALGLPRLGFDRRPRRCASSRLHRRSARPSCRRPGSEAFARRPPAAQILLTPADVADRQTYVNAATRSTHCSGSGPCRS